MLKRINWKAILYSFLWLLCLSSLVVLMSFIEVKEEATVCTDVRIIMPGDQNFIERSEVDEILLNSSGKLVGKAMRDINIHALEKALRINPFIESAKVFSDMDGVVHVWIDQRDPVIRIINIADQDFYVDRNGLKIPTSASFTANVLVANGQITESFNNRVDTMRSKLAKDLFKTAQFIEKDRLWKDQIEQVYVDRDGEIQLIPRVGNHRIILGNADSLETKFNNLLVFYKKGIPRVGWDAYREISIKYTNQIVGVRTTASMEKIDSIKTAMKKAKRAAADSVNKATKTLQDTINN